MMFSWQQTWYQQYVLEGLRLGKGCLGDFGRLSGYRCNKQFSSEISPEGNGTNEAHVLLQKTIRTTSKQIIVARVWCVNDVSCMNISWNMLKLTNWQRQQFCDLSVHAPPLAASKETLRRAARAAHGETCKGLLGTVESQWFWWELYIHRAAESALLLMFFLPFWWLPKMFWWPICQFEQNFPRIKSTETWQKYDGRVD